MVQVRVCAVAGGEAPGISMTNDEALMAKE